MRRNIGLVVAWILATLLAVTVASAAVAGIRDEVTDRPASVGAPPEALAAEESAVPEELAATIPAASTSTTVADSGTLEGHETTTSTDGTDSTTSTTQPVSTSSTTTTVSPSTEYSKTFDTVGGSVRIRVIGDSVEFAGAYPASGWRVELENAGPEKVEIHFERDGEDAENEEDEIEFKAWVDDGELRVDISTE